MSDDKSDAGLKKVADKQAENNVKPCRKPKAKEDKITKRDIAITVLDAMQGQPWVKHAYPHHYLIECDSQGNRRALEIAEDGETVRYIVDKKIIDDIMTYCHKKLGPKIPEAKDIKAADAEHMANAWIALQPRILTGTGIKILTQKSEPGLTFRKLPFDYIGRENEPTPYFDEFVSRITVNRNAFILFFGSLFFLDSARQQCLFLHGEGQTGRSSFLNFLQFIFEEAFFAAQPPSSHFWTSLIPGRRVLAFPDCNDRKWITSPLFKSLTGDDAIQMERKNGAIYCAKINAKIIVVSNFSAQITSSFAEQRRLIYCEMSKVENEQVLKADNYLEKLCAEAPAFIAKCVQAFMPYKDAAYIPVEAGSTQAIADQTEEELQIVFDRYFMLDEEGASEPGFVGAGAFFDLLRKEERCSTNRIREFKEFLKNRLRLGERHYVGGRKNRQWVYTGFAMKPIWEAQHAATIANSCGGEVVSSDERAKVKKDIVQEIVKLRLAKSEVNNNRNCTLSP